MPAKSLILGHDAEWLNGRWVYCDTKAPVDEHRICKRCGNPPTPEGYDACLGHIKGAISACCGHGVGEKILIMGQRNES